MRRDASTHKMQVVLISKKSWSVPKKGRSRFKIRSKKGPSKALFFIRVPLKGRAPSRQKGDMFGAKVEVIGSYQVVVDFVFDSI